MRTPVAKMAGAKNCKPKTLGKIRAFRRLGEHNSRASVKGLIYSGGREAKLSVFY